MAAGLEAARLLRRHTRIRFRVLVMPESSGRDFVNPFVLQVVILDKSRRAGKAGRPATRGVHARDDTCQTQGSCGSEAEVKGKIRMISWQDIVCEVVGVWSSMYTVTGSSATHSDEP